MGRMRTAATTYLPVFTQRRRGRIFVRQRIGIASNSCGGSDREHELNDKLTQVSLYRLAHVKYKQACWIIASKYPSKLGIDNMANVAENAFTDLR